MMNETAIKLQEMSKKYRVYFEKPALVRSLFPFLFSGKGHHEFWSLRDIDLEIKKGECIGVIGPNGAGKSTLLSILSGITEPTLGSVQIDGKISALLSLGAGFQQELTGRENIYLNAAILGMKRRQVDELFGAIVDYAGIGEFMEAKLSTYSSGMNMRLGFAIAVNVAFDILLIDELLAVGDMAFQQKCFKTMRDFTEDEDRTIIFVSHDVGRIEEICNRAVWLENGRVEEVDSAEVVARKYRERYRHKYEAFELRISRKEKEHKAEITINTEENGRIIPKGIFGTNLDWTIDGTQICDIANKRFNQFLLKILTPYHFSIFRYPGGQSADYFHWEQAVGSSRKNQIEGTSKTEGYPYFGPDELISFLRCMRAEPMLTLNVGSGSIREGLSWVSYMKEKGVSLPYLELGHELYYDEYHNLGRDFYLSPKEYADKSLELAKGLINITPDSKLIFMACKDTGVFTRYSHEDWNRVLLQTCGEYIDYLSVHSATVPILNITEKYELPELETTVSALLAAPYYVEDNLKQTMEDVHHLRRDLAAKIRLAVTEYNAMFTDIPPVVHGTHKIEGYTGDHVEWERNTYLASALLEASLLNLFIKNECVDLACRFSLLSGIYSCLYRYVEGIWIMAPQAYVHMLYNRLAGHKLISHSTKVDCYDSEAVGILPPRSAVPYLDTLSIKTEDGEQVILIVINRHLAKEVTGTIKLQGFNSAELVIKRVTAPQFYSRNTAQVPNAINYYEQSFFAEHVSDDSGRFNIVFPKHSLSFIVFKKKTWL
ncbi:MAG: ATP-binding cassette domain-containing protein [Candidatus Aureabacteria bacterium]|nr:ATP-binding cassette domain-containing protein [Candidatus Auribacterota bacterium]